MPKPRTTEEKLARLNALAGAPLSAEGARELVSTLTGSGNIVAARAAQLMGQSGDRDFIPHLAATFEHLLHQPASADPNCRAKEAIILALESLHNLDPTPYLAGARHVQMEPVFGGKADTAANLRGSSITALARMRHPDAHLALIPLLIDPEPQPRLAAVNVLAYLGGEKSELLLRMKVLTGDQSPEILRKCFTALIALDPDRSLPFVAEYLNADDLGRAEQAALALGESREDAAFDLLRAHWEQNTVLALNKALLLAIALTRGERAFDFLLDIIRNEGRGNAVKAVEALAIYAADPRRYLRIAEAVEACGDAKVIETFREEFGGERG